ncbi:beta-N-acetylglucosaminidase domain-containing protein [Paenibacillus sp. LHD-117]|uniref:beta-N-acetylglucosaminidase domain-containing protein n=1 Tax=Paenibacillus sp. LHD-117 TaxID=3071412 RepID=UPI0027E1CD61|nr:beta-N-acetylglucosaminidase domain-containing protein [Paenibacillus sp. LHD-117]MDQ6422168.1 beta-N-acetylglucosaminidase domain-containing protein [Paenibacillus sp. LHD-117]
MLKRVMGLVLAVVMTAGAFAEISAASPEANAAIQDSYEIYPIPQKQTYSGSEFELTGGVNVVLEDGIDQSTRNRLNAILASKSLQASRSAGVSPDKTNVLIGIKGSGGVVDRYFASRIDYDEAVFEEEDAYVLVIDGELEAKGSIAILGASTDAAYYGLATLNMIFDQLDDTTVKSVLYEDFADSKWRGFIEGFYGFPWSHEDRMSLMRFGGKIKMNSYIFAPKDDLYHNSAWRTLYPQAELAKIKELVDVGHESKTQFVWAIHPGFSMIKWNDYEAELATLIAKLEQLYSVGVRQFGLFMDDISTGQSLTDKDKHVRLVTDVANWAAGKGDVKSLIYCPPFYNKAWTGESGKPYLQALRAVPENVEIMWTGNDVIGGVNPSENQWVKDEIGRDPYIWFNYPVNGYKKNRLLLGKVPMLAPGTDNFSGIVSNPLEQAELSKIALFGVADYTWNVDAFDNGQSWRDSFKYIEEEVAEEYNTIAYHMSDPSPNGRGVVFDESENVKAQLEAFLSAYNSGASIQAAGNELIAQFNHILEAIQGFRTKLDNPSLMDEIEPWLNSLYFVVLADKYAVESAIALQDGDNQAAWEALAKASKAMAESKTFTREVLGAQPQIVEAGAKRLAPFANQLIQKLDTAMYAEFDPAYYAALPASSYGSLPGIANMLDGDLKTNVYIQTLQKNGDWYGVDFGKPIRVSDIEILQGRTDTDHDIFQRGMLEYSLDGQTWTAIGEERSGFRIQVGGLDVEAQYIRYRLTHAGIPGGKPDLWTAVREFAVNQHSRKPMIYTNVPELANTAVTFGGASAQLSNVNGITLGPSEYVGIKLTSIENISHITLARSTDDAVLEASVNGLEWQPVTPGSSLYPSAAYVRLVNKGEQPITMDVTTLQVQYEKFADPVVTHNYSSVHQGSLSAVFDRSLEAKVWFNGRQTPGRYVQVDMGGIVNVQNAGVVINDGEGDYFRQGDLQLSVDGVNWETIHTFSNPGDRSKNFPEHVAPYRYLRVEVDHKPARYIRLYTTVDNAGWLALNEILVNEGIDRPGTESPVIVAEPQGSMGNEAVLAIDQKLSTAYAPQETSEAGQLHYKLFKFTELDQITILQSPSTLSNARVSIRDEEGWHEAGSLMQAYNSIDTSAYEHVFDVRLEWDSGSAPIIHRSEGRHRRTSNGAASVGIGSAGYRECRRHLYRSIRAGSSEQRSIRSTHYDRLQPGCNGIPVGGFVEGRHQLS